MLRQKAKRGISGAIRLLLLIATILAVLTSTVQGQSSKYPNFKENSKSTCAVVQPGTFYHTSLMRCQECQQNKERLSDNGDKCVCKDGYNRQETDLSRFYPTCSKCPDEQSENQAGTKCLKCTDATVELSQSRCICKEKDFFMVEKADEFICEKCPAKPTDVDDNKEFWRPPRSIPMMECERCLDEGFIYDNDVDTNENDVAANCVCDQAKFYEPSGGICISRNEYNKRRNGNVVGITVELPDRLKVQSNTLQYLGLKAIVGCSQYGSSKDCQMLANLCVLSNYDQSQDFCREFVELMNKRRPVRSEFYDNDGWKEDLPWLYYWKGTSNQDPNEVLLKSGKVQFRASFVENNPQKGILNKLSFKVAAYDIEGNFLGFEDMRDQIIVCEVGDQDLAQFKIGSSIHKKCLFDLNLLTNQLTYPRKTNVFYDLFLVDANDNLVDVPVRIDGQKELYRRFFILDTLTGLQNANSYVNKDQPAYLRYAKNVTLTVTLDPQIPERILVPVLDIYYLAVETEDVLANKDQVRENTEVLFRIEYTMETDGFWSFAETVFWIFFSITLIVVLGQFYLSATAERLDTGNLQQGTSQADQLFLIFKMLTISIEKFGNILFWFMVAMTSFWFVFFKFQSRVVVFFPASPESSEESFAKNYQPFDKMLAVVTSFKIFSLAYKIYFEQSKLDIFFIDWETPKLFQLTEGKMRSMPSRGVNPWRRLFVANEFNELQSQRLLEPDFMLLLFLVIADGFGLKYFNQLEVDFNNQKSGATENYILGFFITFGILFAVGTLNYFFSIGIAIWNPPPYLDFVDLCSVANISIIIFNEELNGYYIHGKSPSGSADVGSQKLSLNLEAEQAGNANVRGMHNSQLYQDKQHFEIFMPPKMIMDYRKHFLTKVMTLIDTANQSNQQNFNELQRQFTLGKALPDKLDMNELYNIEELTTKIMKQYIDKVSSEPQQYIAHRSRTDRFLNTNPRNQKVPIMYFDTIIPSFTNAFLYGLEFDFFIMQVLVIASLDRMDSLNEDSAVISRIVLGVLIAHQIDGFLVLIRQIFGSRNLAVHTLIDQRFLVD